MFLDIGSRTPLQIAQRIVYTWLTQARGSPTAMECQDFIHSGLHSGRVPHCRIYRTMVMLSTMERLLTISRAIRPNPLKGSGGRRLHFEVFSAIQV